MASGSFQNQKLTSKPPGYFWNYIANTYRLHLLTHLSVIREVDCVARLGGEEFALVPGGMAEQRGHIDIKKRLLRFSGHG